MSPTSCPLTILFYNFDIASEETTDKERKNNSQTSGGHNGVSAFSVFGLRPSHARVFLPTALVSVSYHLTFYWFPFSFRHNARRGLGVGRGLQPSDKQNYSLV